MSEHALRSEAREAPQADDSGTRATAAPLDPRSYADGHVAHQFETREQQHEAATLGMWAFLATEVLFFGGLFLGYTAYRHQYTQAFEVGSRELWMSLGGINTAVLLCSSLAMALGVHAATTGNRRHTVRWLLITIALGLTFLGIKATEYAIDWHEGLVPRLNFNPLREPDSRIYKELQAAAKAQPGVEVSAVDDAQRSAGLKDEANHLELFFVFYFCMTMLHAIHMVIGIGIIGVLAWLAHRGKFEGGNTNAVELTGLYWHFVDIVWVFLFPMLYLLRH